jgi:cyanate permease
LLGSTLASEHASRAGIMGTAAAVLTEAWKSRASNAFNLGGLLGAFAAIPLARLLGRRPMFVVYFVYSGVALLATFGLDLEPATRLRMLFAVGAGVYGVFAAFTFYLPELFPVHLRATGAGFCYNIGRVLAAAGPLAVGWISAAAGGSSAVIVRTLFWVGLIPLAAGVVAHFVFVETKGRVLISRAER